ncbi:MAG TPA: cysteine dioxygenase family protein [Gammaproteobacteria bacterium]|nr:cysteine dioxygenase family protein [Gammaproteobacteria bacterium]
MQTVEFQGASRLIPLLDEAVRRADPRTTTHAIKDLLCELFRERGVGLPAGVCQPCAESYARRLLYRSEDLGYTVVAMTWGPGQGTLIHDHAGMWCVEGVWDGQIEVQQYEIAERSGERYRFEHCGTIQAGTGSAGCLIPPHEYHLIRNPLPDRSAVSLHIYGGEMESCHVFEPMGGEWYQRCSKPLHYT